MTALDRAAVAATPLTVAEVEAIYDDFQFRDSLFGMIRRLCESHERLRRELKATEELLTNPKE